MLEQELLDSRPPFHFPLFYQHLLVERKDFWFQQHMCPLGRVRLVGKSRA